jgi:small subunit ribosomal protein S8
MAMTDPVADMLTRIRNVVMVGRREVDVPYSNLKRAIADALVREGYLVKVDVAGEGPEKVLRLELKYGPDGEKVIRMIKRESKPGRRLYNRSRDIPRVLDGLGTAIISTSKGVLSDRECRRANVGGEVLCIVW